MKKSLIALVAGVFITPIVATSALAAPVGDPSVLSDIVSNTTDCAGAGVGYSPTTGKTLAAWTTQGANPQEVQFTLLNDDGTGNDVTAYVNADANVPPFNDCEPAAVAGAPNGGFLIVWSDDEQITGLLVDSSGAAVGSHFAVSSNVNYYDIETVDAEWSDADNKFLVAWKANVSDAFDTEVADEQLVGRFVTSAGTASAGDFLITNNPDQYDNSIDLSFGDGVWGVVGNINGNNPFVTFVSGDGSLSDEFACQVTAENTGGASLAYNANVDAFLCIWKSGETVEGNLLSTSGDLLFESDTALVASTVSARPRLASLGVDGWLISWHGVQKKDVFAQTVDVEGVASSDIETVSAGVNDQTVEVNFRPVVAFAPATGFAHIVWVRNIRSASETQVYSRAWYVREGEGLPESLADTGFAPGLLFVSALALVGVGVVVRRRSAR